MIPPAARTFNTVAANLTAQDRKALLASIWAGEGRVLDDESGQSIPVSPDKLAQDGELLFYVGFLGSKRDAIPTQHYMIAAPDGRTAVARAHELYQQQPRQRKGASLQVMVGKPPSAQSRA